MTLLLQSPSFELWWEPQQGTVRLQSPGRELAGVIGVEFLRQNRSVILSTEKLTPGRVVQDTIEDAHGQAQEAHIYYQEAHNLALCLRMRFYGARPFILYRLSVTNIGPETIKLRRFFMQTSSDGFRASAPPIGCYTNGWQSWSPAGFLPHNARGFSPLFLSSGCKAL